MSGAGRADGLVRFALPALGVLGAALILLRGAHYGVGLSWDSASYVSAARSLLAGDGFLEWNGARYQGGGPLFPLLLAAAGLFGIDVIDAAGYVNAAAFGLTVFAVAAWLKRRLRSPLLAVWAGCACAASLALASAAAYAWTEIVFVLCTVVSLSLLDRFLSRPTAPALLLAAAAAAAACLTRYVGVTLIGAGALILLLRNDLEMRARLRDTALWAAVSLAPVGGWIARNLLVLGSPLGTAYPEEFSGLLSLHRATGEFALWLLGPTGFDLLNGALGSVTGIELAGPATVPAIVAKSVLLAAPALGAGYALARYRPGFLRANRAPLTVAIVFAAAYSLFLVVFLPLYYTLPVRYLVPLFPPLLVVATLALDGFIANGSFTNAKAAAKAGPAGTAVPVVVAIGMSLWLALQAGAAWSDIRGWMNQGAGYASRRWIESDVIRYLRANRLDGAVLSSEPPLIYFFTELRAWTIGRSLAEVADQLAIQDPTVATYFVVFKRSHDIRSYGYGVGDLSALPGVELVAALDDGAIFMSAASVAASDIASDVASGAESAPVANVIRSHFDVHVYEDALAYFKQPCAAEDVTAGFFLHVVPTDSAGLPAENRDFSFPERGYVLDGRCLAVVALPDYPIARIRTGQYVTGEGGTWEVEYVP